jgi:hypothetical protein
MGFGLIRNVAEIIGSSRIWAILEEPNYSGHIPKDNNNNHLFGVVSFLDKIHNPLN